METEGQLLKDINIVESSGWKDQHMVKGYGESMRAFAGGEMAYRLAYESETVIIFERNAR